MIDPFKMTLQEMADAIEKANAEEMYAMASEVQRRILKHESQGKAPKKKLFTTLQLLSA
jgi:citrate synthase